MRVICLIPARAGSKGLTDKNMLFLDGKPMIFHTIDAALESGIFAPEDIYVSTDSPLYAQICQTKGVTVLHRAPHLASDTATSYEVIEDFLHAFPKEQVFVLLQPTSPLRKSVHIKEAVAQFVHSDAAHLVSYVKADKSPDLYALLDDRGYVQGQYGIDQGYRRQDKQQYYVPNGAIFISRKKRYLEDKSYFTAETLAYVMDKEPSLDIDDVVDFKRAIASHYFDYKKREDTWQSMFQEKYQQLSKTSGHKLIVGDSRLVGFGHHGYTNISIPGVTMHTFMVNKERFLSQEVTDIVLALGINDFTTGYTLSSLKQQFQELVTICQEKQIQLSISSIALTLFRLIDNETVIQFNQWLEKLCSEKNIPFIDVNTVLSEDHHLKFEMTSDGVHFTTIGETLYFSHIQKLINKEG